MNIKWNNKFSVKIDIFDTHNKKLIYLLNFLHGMLNSDIYIKVIDNISYESIDYIKYCLSQEKEENYEKI